MRKVMVDEKGKIKLVSYEETMNEIEKQYKSNRQKKVAEIYNIKVGKEV